MDYKELYEKLASVIGSNEVDLEVALNVVSNIQIQLMYNIYDTTRGRAKENLLAMLDNIRNAFVETVEAKGLDVKNITPLGEA